MPVPLTVMAPSPSEVVPSYTLVTLASDTVSGVRKLRSKGVASPSYKRQVAVLPPVLDRLQPVKVASSLSSAVVLPVPNALVDRPELSVAQKLLVPVAPVLACATRPPAKLDVLGVEPVTVPVA